MQASAYSNSYSDLTVNWPRPNDAPGGNGAPSCIDEYSVEVFRVSRLLGSGSWATHLYSP
jgi:hypothetical protein